MGGVQRRGARTSPPTGVRLTSGSRCSPPGGTTTWRAAWARRSSTTPTRPAGEAPQYGTKSSRLRRCGPSLTSTRTVTASSRRPSCARRSGRTCPSTPSSRRPTRTGTARSTTRSSATSYGIREPRRGAAEPTAQAPALEAPTPSSPFAVARPPEKRRRKAEALRIVAHGSSEPSRTPPRTLYSYSFEKKKKKKRGAPGGKKKKKKKRRPRGEKKKKKKKKK